MSRYTYNIIRMHSMENGRMALAYISLHYNLSPDVQNVEAGLISDHTLSPTKENTREYTYNRPCII